MANNYLQFSESLELKNPEEKEWFRRYLDAVDRDSEEHWGRAGTPLTEASRFWDDLCKEHDCEVLSFNVDIRDTHVSFVAEEGGNPDEVAKWVQHFFKEMRPTGKDFFTLSWAETCSKMRTGEFGGGALCVTKDTMEYMSSWSFIEEMTLKYDKK